MGSIVLAGGLYGPPETNPYRPPILNPDRGCIMLKEKKPGSTKDSGSLFLYKSIELIFQLTINVIDKLL